MLYWLKTFMLIYLFIYFRDELNFCKYPQDYFSSVVPHKVSFSWVPLWHMLQISSVPLRPASLCSPSKQTSVASPAPWIQLLSDIGVYIISEGSVLFWESEAWEMLLPFVALRRRSELCYEYEAWEVREKIVEVLDMFFNREQHYNVIESYKKSIYPLFKINYIFFLVFWLRTNKQKCTLPDSSVLRRNILLQLYWTLPSLSPMFWLNATCQCKAKRPILCIDLVFNYL